jgi:crotonobetainyl-CoA:carnitine CoA-transferase CaiB-like acyl-CoA transferase
VVMKRLKKFLKRNAEPQKPPEVEVQRQHHLQDDYEQAMLAISFAEAGAPDQAVEVMRQYGKRKILVVTQEDAFTESVIDYATGLAERLGYELIALNVGTAPSNKAVSAYQEHMREEFQERAAQAAAPLAEKAAARHIPITHVVKFGDVAKAVEAIKRDYRRIELMITDSRTKKEDLPARVNLPVFSLKTHQ